MGNITFGTYLGYIWDMCDLKTIFLRKTTKSIFEDMGLWGTTSAKIVQIVQLKIPKVP